MAKAKLIVGAGVAAALLLTSSALAFGGFLITVRTPSVSPGKLPRLQGK